MCPGCYKNELNSYCPRCRKALFGGLKISHVLNFAPPKADNLPAYQEKTKRLSISGVQLKYSLRLNGKDLELTEAGGQYILKPIPPSALIIETDEAPENEHLTMQIASQVFGIRTAANALIYFSDGTPAYLTRRFDVREDGSKFLQEDMAQISGRTRQTEGENFKYSGTYEEIGKLIHQHVAAAPLELETYFRILLFNYLFSNGDAHLKNFSLIQSEMGDFRLTPAYDIMCTVLHTPIEGDTALDLFKGDLDTPFFKKYGYYGQAAFRELANRLGIKSIRANRILTQLMGSRDQVLSMIKHSFLKQTTKEAYRKAYLDKIRRMGMTGEMIAKSINPQFPGVYAPTEVPTRLTFLNNEKLIGFFDYTTDSDTLASDNKYTFVELANAKKPNRISIVEGDLLFSVEYPDK